MIGESSRIAFHEAEPTHRVMCRAKPGQVLIDLLSNKPMDQTISYEFDQFVRLTDNGWYEENPNFDCVKIDSDEGDVLLKHANIDYFLAPLA